MNKLYRLAETTPEFYKQEELCKSKDKNVLYGLASNPHLFVHFQFILVHSQDAYVRAFLASNPEINYSIQSKLASDPDKTVRENLAINPKLSHDFFPKLFVEFRSKIFSKMLNFGLKYTFDAKTQALANKYLSLYKDNRAKLLKRKMSQEIKNFKILKNFDEKYYLYFMKNGSFQMSDDFLKDLNNLQNIKAHSKEVEYTTNPTLFSINLNKEYDFELKLTWKNE